MDNSGIIKRPASGRFGGYTYLAKSGVSQQIADNILFGVAVASGYTLDVLPAIVAISGQSVGVRAGRNIEVNPAAVAIAGSLVGIRQGRRLTVNPGTVATTGQAIALRVGLSLAANAATVPIVGQSVTLTKTTAGLILSALPATVSTAGQTVGLSRANLLTVLPASVSVAGQLVGLKAGRWLPASPAAVEVAGQSVTLTKSSAGLTFTVEPGAILITGQPVMLEVGAGADADRRTSVGGGKERRFIADVIWPDDPRHPQYIGRDLPVEDVAPKREPVVVKLNPRSPAPPVAAVIKPDTTDFNRALALLLLAA